VEAERIAKLPKWAQQYIHKLERDVEWYKEQLRQTSSGDSPITWELGSIHNSKQHGIPERATVRFQLANGYIECALRKTTLQIRRGSFKGRLMVGPCAYNLVEIEIVEK
jgi:hypothetical protein